ncbi:MAG: cation:proton antiporter [Anaerolineae bacterium]|nr:cation:proton antiporter [Anaerolineae bacterium]
MTVVLTLVALMLSLSLGFAFIRLVRGPSVPDRVVAFDFIATLGIGIIAVYSIATDQSIYLDVAIVLALISFLGTIAFARYVERNG